MKNRFDLYSARHYKYFNKRVSRGLKSLFANFILTNFAGGLFAIFLPIFLYEFFQKNLQLVLSYYLVGFVLTLLIIVLGAKKLNKFGFKRALQLSVLFSVAFYASLFFLNQNNLIYIIPLSIIFLAFQRFLYWLPYNTDFAKFSNDEDRGKTIGYIEILLSLAGAITPLIAGLVIEGFGFNWLFLLAVIILCFSYFPLVGVPRTREKFSWSVKKTVQKVFSKQNRITALIFFAEGAEGVIFSVIWPIFIFQLLRGQYLEIGIISTLTVFVVIVTQFVIGRKSDGPKKGKEKLIRYGGVFYSLIWLVKIFVLTALHIFVIDVFHKLTQIFYKIPLDALVFEKASKQKHLVDEFVIFREICLFSGRAVMIILILIVSFGVSLNVLFVFGMIFALIEVLFHRSFYCSLK